MLPFAFLLGAIALFIQTILFSHFVLIVFAPWIALCVLKESGIKPLYLSFCAGVFMDLLSDDPMGLHALNYTITALFLFRYRFFFSLESPFHFALFTALAGFSSTLLQLFLLFLFDRRVPFTGEWALADLFIMPFADAVYALLWFFYPLKAFQKMSRIGGVYWRKIRERLFPI